MSAIRAPKAQPKLVATKAKKATLTVAKARKALVKAKPPPKSLVKHVVDTPIEEVVISGVAVGRTASCTINLPQRFR